MTNQKLRGLAEEILRESTFYQNEVPQHTCVMMEKWARELAALAETGDPASLAAVDPVGGSGTEGPRASDRDLSTIGSPPPETPAPPDEVATLPPSLRASLDLFREDPQAWHAEWTRKHENGVRLIQRAEAAEARLAQVEAERDRITTQSNNYSDALRALEARLAQVEAERDAARLTVASERLIHQTEIARRRADANTLRCEIRDTGYELEAAEARADACAVTLAQVQQLITAWRAQAETDAGKDYSHYRDGISDGYYHAAEDLEAVLAAVPGTKK